MQLFFIIVVILIKYYLIIYLNTFQYIFYLLNFLFWNLGNWQTLEFSWDRKSLVLIGIINWHTDNKMDEIVF